MPRRNTTSEGGGGSARPRRGRGSRRRDQPDADVEEEVEGEKEGEGERKLDKERDHGEVGGGGGNPRRERGPRREADPERNMYKEDKAEEEYGKVTPCAAAGDSGGGRRESLITPLDAGTGDSHRRSRSRRGGGDEGYDLVAIHAEPTAKGRSLAPLHEAVAGAGRGTRAQRDGGVEAKVDADGAAVTPYAADGDPDSSGRESLTTPADAGGRGSRRRRGSRRDRDDGEEGEDKSLTPLHQCGGGDQRGRRSRRGGKEREGHRDIEERIKTRKGKILAPAGGRRVSSSRPDCAEAEEGKDDDRRGPRRRGSSSRRGRVEEGDRELTGKRQVARGGSPPGRGVLPAVDEEETAGEPHAIQDDSTRFMKVSPKTKQKRKQKSDQDEEDEEEQKQFLMLDKHKVALALAEATKRVRENQQHRAEDIPVFRMPMNPSKRAIHRAMIFQHGRIMTVRSTIVKGSPVTSPKPKSPEQETYHIIKMVAEQKKGEAEKSINFLFQESDMYYTAFEPCSDVHKDELFFSFNDVRLPSWLKHSAIPYNSSHGAIVDFMMKKDWWRHMFYTYLKVNFDNHKSRCTERKKVSNMTMVLLCEAFRFRGLQKQVKNLKPHEEKNVGDFEDRIHGWRDLSKMGLNYEFDEKEMMHMEKVNASYSAYDLTCSKKETPYVPWPIIGNTGELIVLKYTRFEVLRLIIKQQEEAVSVICMLLKEHLSSESDKGYVLHQLQQCKEKYEDFNNYLAYILTHGKENSVKVRQLAGLFLKKNMEENFSSLPIACREYIMSQLLLCMGGSKGVVRSTVGSVISTIFKITGVAGWTELFKTLLDSLDSEQGDQIEGAMDVIYKICEEAPSALDCHNKELTDRPINLLMPRLLQFFESEHVHLRKLALGCIYHCIVVKSFALDSFFEHYLQGLIRLADDSSADVRKLVCLSFVELLKVRPSVLEPHLKNVIEVILKANNDPVYEVALEACEFWWTYSEANMAPEVLREFLPRLIPTLFSNMIHADDYEDLHDSEETECFPLRSQLYVQDCSNAVNCWDLRKRSFDGMEALSDLFGDDILPTLIPLIKKSMAQADNESWKERGRTVMSIGAIAERCITGLDPHLPQIVAFLVPLLDDSSPFVRSITCWTLSRLVKFILQTLGYPKCREQFDKIIIGLLRGMLDSNQRVQDAACSAFTIFEEEAAKELAPNLQDILEHLMRAFGNCQKQNIRILCALGNLADAVGTELNQEKHTELFMPSLMVQWHQLSLSRTSVFPLFKCITSIAQALGPGFSPFSEPVYQRCVNIIQGQQFAKAQLSLVDPKAAGALYNTELIVSSLELLSGLSASIENLALRSDLRDLVEKCCKDEAHEVRESAMALASAIGIQMD